MIVQFNNQNQPQSKHFIKHYSVVLVYYQLLAILIACFSFSQITNFVIIILQFLHLIYIIKTKLYRNQVRGIVNCPIILTFQYFIQLQRLTETAYFNGTMQTQRITFLLFVLYLVLLINIIVMVYSIRSKGSKTQLSQLSNRIKQNGITSSEIMQNKTERVKTKIQNKLKQMNTQQNLVVEESDKNVQINRRNLPLQSTNVEIVNLQDQESQQRRFQ